VRTANTNPATGSLTAEVYCRKGAATLSEVSTSTMARASTGPGDYPVDTAFATCPRGTPAAGGFSAVVDIPMPGAFGGPLTFSSYRGPANSWGVAGINTATTPRALTAYAYCTSRPA